MTSGLTRLDRFLAYSESNRLTVTALAAAQIVLIALADWMLPDVSIGYLYLIPVLLSAAALNGIQIVTMAIVCAYLREAFDPLQGLPGFPVFSALNPLLWAPGSAGRLLVGACAFSMTGFFVTELNRRRRLLADHLQERQDRQFAVRMLIETSPLAILTLDEGGRIVLANESARQVLGFENDPLQGKPVAPFLPILDRMLHSHTGGNIRTSVECKGQRRNGEVFLAHAWLSTYKTSQGPGLAAVVWDASENLRDREGAGLDSMMATSRVLIGAMSHEIRNLASAAASAYAAIGSESEMRNSQEYQALGTLIRGLEKIASSGLRVASDREAAIADLGTVLDETRIVIEPGLSDAGIAVHWEIERNLPLVQADHHSLLQVFVNLARNSQKALEDCEQREVRISAAVERDLVVVRFRDSGPGVPNPDELFRPFQPGAATPDSFGLGLYISRAILRAHGGGLRYEPQEAGCCFTVELWPVENAIEG